MMQLQRDRLETYLFLRALPKNTDDFWELTRLMLSINSMFMVRLLNDPYQYIICLIEELGRQQGG